MAIDDLLDEHEQEQRVRNWLRRNGLGIVGGVTAGLLLIWGWQTWQANSLASSAADHARYQSVVAGIASSDLDKAAEHLKSLEAESEGIYVDLAALSLAKAQVEAGQIDQAITSLRGLKADGDFQIIVNQRIARLLIESGKPADALKVLGNAADAGSLEVSGDAYMADGKREQARAAYTRALDLLEPAVPQRRLLEIKLSDAGGTVPSAGADN